MTTYADNPQLWRERAEEARTQAERMSGAESKRRVLKVAAGYELMAARAEARMTKEVAEELLNVRR